MIAIDPGVHRVYCARFIDKALQKVFSLQAVDLYELGEELRPLAAEAGRIVVECPRMYVKGAARPDDILRLAGVANVCASCCPKYTLVEPARWKGQLTKKVHHRRAKDVLYPFEHQMWYESVHDHNLLDAICLGLWASGRLPLTGQG